MFRFYRSKKPLGSFGVMLATLVFWGLCGQTHASDPKITPSVQRFSKLMVMPFRDLYEVYGDEASYRCPFTGKVQMIGPVAASADEFLTEQLMLMIKEHTAYQPKLVDRASGLVAEHLSGQKRISSEMDFLVAVGTDYGAELILAGYLYRFEERVGNNYAAEAPASVAFSLYLIEVNSKQLLWARHFDETQKPLSDNLFKLSDFIKRKGRWVTAREMASAALEEMVHDLPKALTTK